jgi:hypothetical protein
MEFADRPEDAWILETSFGERGAVDSLAKALVIANANGSSRLYDS